MDKILALFLIGLAVGILVPLAENFYQLSELLDEPITTIEHIFVAGHQNCSNLVCSV